MKALLFWTVLFLQDDSARPIRELIEKLASERSEERESGARKLKDLGKAAQPELRRAIRLGDAEVVARVRPLLGRIELQDHFSADFFRKDPALLDRLIEGGDVVWKDAFIELIRVQGGTPLMKPPRSDFERLAARAVAGCETLDERKRVCLQIKMKGLRSAIPGLLILLDDPGPDTRALGVETLCALGAQEQVAAIATSAGNPDAGAQELSAEIRSAIPAIAARIIDEHPVVRQQAFFALRCLAPAEAPALLLSLLDQAAPEGRAEIARALGALAGKASIPTLRRLAEDPESAVRHAAAAALCGLGDRKAVPLLVRLLKDTDGEVRKSAALSLEGVEAKETLPEILKLIGDPEESVRSSVASICGRMKFRPAVPLLVKALEDPEPEVRSSALSALMELRAREALPSLLRRLEDGDAEVRAVAVRALAGAGPREAAPHLLKMLEDPDEFVRSATADAFRELEWRPAVPALIKALKDPSKDVQRSILSALGELGGLEAARELVRLRPTDPDASKALYNFSRGELWPVILPMLKSPDAGTRKNAVEAAGIGGVVQAIPDLLPLLDDADPEIRLGTMRTLNGFNTVRSIPGLLRRLGGEERRDIRLEAARDLGWLRAREAIPGLTALLRSSDAEERVAAAGALAPMGVKEAVAESLALLRHESAAIQRNAAWIAADAGEPEVLPLLLRYLESNDDGIRQLALSGLIRLKSLESIPKIATLLEDGSVRIRLSAAQALGTLGAKEAVPALIKRLEDLEMFGRITALQALEQLKAAEALPAILLLVENHNYPQQPENFAKTGGQAGVRYMLPWLKQDPTRRRFALDVLAALGSKEWIADLLPLLKDEDAGVRSGAALAAGILGTKEAIPALIALLQDGNEDLRRNAVRALADLKAAAASTAISNLLSDNDPLNRCAAADALGRLGAKEGIPGIRSLLGEGPTRGIPASWAEGRDRGREDVRWTALRALGRLEDREGLPLMKPLLNDARPALRLQAASWMCRLGSKEGAPMLLAEADHLVSLNALRRPEQWARLDSGEFKEDLEGTTREMLERVVVAAGLAMEVSPGALDYEERWNVNRWRTRVREDGGRLPEVLEHLLPESCTAILESDRIRIVGREEGFQFWQEWWEREGKPR
jgi:HEAT repeat protein